MNNYANTCKGYPKLTDDIYIVDDSDDIKKFKGKWNGFGKEPDVLLSFDDDCPTLYWFNYDTGLTLIERSFKTMTEAKAYKG